MREFYVIEIILFSLLPISIPSIETKSMKVLYAVSIILFILECIFVFPFAYLIRHFYHFELCILQRRLLQYPARESFDSLVVFLACSSFSLTLTAIAFLLLCSSNNCSELVFLFWQLTLKDSPHLTQN